MNNSKRRRATAGAGRAGEAARVPPPGQQPRLRHSTGDANTARDPHPPQHSHPHRASSCRLCCSTLRVLSVARAHRKRCRHLQQQQQQQQQQQHEECQAHPSDNRVTSPRVSGCEACRMWSMVGERCAVLGISLPGDLFASVGGGGADLSENGVAVPATAMAAAAAAGSARPDYSGPVVRVDTVANE
eukprot:g10476.t1